MVPCSSLRLGELDFVERVGVDPHAPENVSRTIGSEPRRPAHVGRHEIDPDAP
jgi:hypothetical protein